MVHCPSISLNNVQISLEQIQKTTQICQNWAQMPYLRAMDIFFENSVPPFTIYNDSTSVQSLRKNVTVGPETNSLETVTFAQTPNTIVALLSKVVNRISVNKLVWYFRT